MATKNELVGLIAEAGYNLPAVSEVFVLFDESISVDLEDGTSFNVAVEDRGAV